jgi:hypothetical protein
VTRGILSQLCLTEHIDKSDRNGWGASAVDAFSTALVMQIPEIVDQILDYIPTINFDEADDEISLFETTIRYVGGLLSGDTTRSPGYF